MAEVTEKVSIVLALKDLVSGDAAKVAAALKSIGAAAKQAGAESAAAGGGTGGTAGLFAAGGAGAVAALEVFQLLREAVGSLVEKVEQAVDAARHSQEVNDRLRASLGDSAALYGEIAAAATNTAAQTRFSADAMTEVAQRLSDRGVSFDQLPKALKATADVATALHKPLEEVADQIAQTFGGTVPRDLKHAVPALEELGEAALQSGAALDVLEQRYGGRALSDALTPSGREAVAVKELAESWKQVGQAMLPIVQEYGPKLANIASVGASLLGHALANNAAAIRTGVTDAVQDSIASVDGDYATALSGYRLQVSTDEANAQLAARHAQLQAEGKDARQQITELQKDIAGQTAAFDADQSAKHLGTVRADVAEEFRLRTAGVDQYLAAIDKAAAADRDPLLKILTDLKEQAGSAAGTADAAANRAAVAPLDSDEQNQADKDEAVALQKLADLSKQILAIRRQIADVDRKAADDQAKAIAEAGQQAGQDAKAAGEKVRGQLGDIGRTDGLNPLADYGQAAAAADEYRASIARVVAEYDQLIAKATAAGDVVEAHHLQDLKFEVKVDADKTLAHVRTLAGDIKDALEAPLAGAFDAMILDQGKLSDRLRAGAQSFLESLSKMLADYASKMAARAVLTALLGAPPAEDGDKGGTGDRGPTGAGGVVGGVLSLLGLGARAAPKGNDVGGGFGDAASGGSFGSAAPDAGPSDAGGGFGDAGAGGETATGAAAGEAGTASGGNPIGDGLSAIGSAIGSVASTVGGAVTSILGAIGQAVVALVTAIATGGQAASSAGGTAGVGALGSVGVGAGEAAGANAATSAATAAADDAAMSEAADEAAVAFAAFDTGGYTGDGHPKDVAGLAHRQEFVFSAPAVKRIGLPTLHALHAGRIDPSAMTMVGARMNGAARPRVTVNLPDDGRGGAAVGGDVTSAMTAHATAATSAARSAQSAAEAAQTAADRVPVAVLHPEAARAAVVGTLNASNGRVMKELLAKYQQRPR